MTRFRNAQLDVFRQYQKSKTFKKEIHGTESF